MKPVRTLILMASESRLRLAENTGVGKGVKELSLRSAADLGVEPTRYADMPGRGQAAPGMAAHGFDRPTSERDQTRDSVAEAIAAAALAEWQKGGYDRLIVAAPPKMLGALRPCLPDALTAVLVADLPKDLTKVPALELAEHLDEVLAV